MRRAAFAITLLAGFGRTIPAAADLPPWRDPLDLPLAPSVRSAVVNRNDVPIEAGPSARSARRGSAVLGARLPVFAAIRGPGCTGRWLNVGPLAWICQDSVTLSEEPPLEVNATRALLSKTGLPYSYFFVGKEGSWAYQSLRDADEATPEAQLEPGFSVAVIEQRAKGVERYGLTAQGLWVPMRDLLGPVRPILFEGEVVPDGRLDFGWVVIENAPVYSKPESSSRTKERHARFQRVPIYEERRVGREVYLRVGEGAWVLARHVRKPTLAAPPDEIRPQERWIDIELASQTLVLYEGTTPVFATLVSTGRGAQGTERATPKGVHRIWVKLRSTKMSNLADDEAEHYYALEDVPHVQFFSRGVGLHAAYWHREFGHVRSQGCVNLAPLDAQKLFELTSPKLPAGWHATLPTSVEEGTVIRVR